MRGHLGTGEGISSAMSLIGVLVYLLQFRDLGTKKIRLPQCKSGCQNAIFPSVSGMGFPLYSFACFVGLVL